MNIGEFANQCGLSIHTLRYYEKIGLLPKIERDGGNRRQYSQRDTVWVDFIKRLKETDMPLKDIRRYAVLRQQGVTTESERMQLLVDHAEKLEETIQQQKEHLLKLNEKIAFYSKRLQKKNIA